LIYPYYREKIEGKLEEVLKRYKKIGITIERKRSIMIDKAKSKQLDLDNFRTERRTTMIKTDFNVPERKRSGIKKEFKTERRQSNMSLMKTVNTQVI